MKFLKYFSLAIVLLAAAALLSWWWLLHTNSGARFVWGKTEALLGGAISASDVRGNFGAGVEIERLTFSSDGVDISADSVKLAADLDVLPLSLRLHGAVIDALALTIDKSDTPDDSQDFDLGGVLDRLKLPLWLLIDSLTVRGATLDGTAIPQPWRVDRAFIRGQWYDRIYIDELIVETPEEKLRLEGRVQLSAPHSIKAQLDLASTQFIIGDDDTLELHLIADGDIRELALSGTGITNLTAYQPLNVKLDGTGTMSSLHLSSLVVEGADLGLSGNASLQWRDGLSVSLSAAIARANINAINEAWPAAHPLKGNVSVVYQPGVVQISDTYVEVSGTDTNVKFSGNFDTTSKSVAGSMNWAQLKWPITAPVPDVASRAGDVIISGTIDAWRIQGKINVEATDVKEGLFVIDGTGDRERADVSISEANVFGGKVSGAASYAWVDRQAWSASLTLQGINIASLLPDWPGVVSGKLNASGRRLDRFVDAQVSGLNGNVRGREFVANGGLQIDGMQFTAKKLSLRHGGSNFVVDGNLYGPSGMTFAADVANLGEVLQGATGEINADGVVSLNMASPFLRINADSQMLTYGDLHISNLQIIDRGDKKGLWHARLSADDLSVGGELLTAPELLVDATTTAQTISLSANYREFATAMQLRGAFDRWDAPKRWDGELESLVINAESGVKVSLDEAAGVAFSTEQIQLQRACFAESRNVAGCASVDWVFSDRIALEANVASVPLEVINSFRDTRFTFNQEVTGNILWRQAVGQRATGSGNINISPGKIISRDRPTFVVDTDTGKIEFDIENGRLLSASLNLPMPGTGHIDGRFSVTDVTTVENSDIDGELRFELQDIAVISILSPLVDTATGRLQGNLDIGGNMQSPFFSGELVLQDGSISYLPLGLHLENVDLNSHLEANRRLNVTGSFRAGDGRGDIVSSAEYDGVAATGLQLQVRGRDLTVIDVPDVFAKADLDLRIGYADDALTINGKVLVPQARVHPQNLPSSRASVSDDVVIVAGELPNQEKIEAESKLTMAGSVDVVLGNDVIIDLDVAKASVAGTTAFTWRGPTVPVANGRYLLAGDIQAFGQVLKIVEGAVRFPNVPASNPLLRVRAEREIYGNTQVRTAGVLVDGTLARPTIEAYTLPATSEERALTLLVTGSDFNYEQGVGAVDFGTYVAPKLFVSYGVGLFGRDNVISARYDLARGFGVKATSGQKESGIDFIYRFER